MKRHSGVFLALVLTVVLLSAGCGQQKQEGDLTDSTQGTQIELTLEELAAYNGKDGNPAYVAVDGIIYDVTNSPKWKNGEHNGYSAGQDLTDIIKQKSPHGVSKLSNVPAIGKIKE